MMYQEFVGDVENQRRYWARNYRELGTSSAPTPMPAIWPSLGGSRPGCPSGSRGS